MAKKPPPPPPGDEDQDEVQASGDDRAPTEDIEVDDLIANLGASAAAARIIVHRIQPNNDPEECIDCPLPVFSKDHLRGEFGPGHYRCEVRHKGVIKRRWEWRFAVPLRGHVTTTPAAATDTRLAELQSELQRARDREAQRAHDLNLALLARPQAQGLQFSDVVSMISTAKEIFGGGERGSPIAQLKELLEVRDLLGGGDGETGAADVALEGLKTLREAFTLAPPAPRAAVTTTERAPPPAASSSSRISAGLTLLAQHAAAATAPEQVAAAAMELLRRLPDAEYETLCSALDQDGAVGLVVLLEPRLANFRPWVEQVLVQLRAQIAQEDADNEPEPAA